MKTIVDNELLLQLRNKADEAYSLLYKEYFPTIKQYVLYNSGSQADAEDVFQESVIILLHKIDKPEFGLTSSVKTYLFAIAKNVWLKHLRHSKRIFTLDGDILEQFSDDGTSASSSYSDASKEDIVATWLSKVTKHCQRILRAIFFLNEPMDSLMQTMGWKNRHTADNQKYKCLQQVKRESNKERL